MKFAFAAIVLTLSVAAFADAVLDVAKTKTVQHLDARITHLQSAKNCVSSATSRDAMKTCQMKLKNDMIALRESTKAERQAQKESGIRERAAAKDAAMKKKAGQ